MTRCVIKINRIENLNTIQAIGAFLGILMHRPSKDYLTRFGTRSDSLHHIQDDEQMENVSHMLYFHGMHCLLS